LIVASIWHYKGISWAVTEGSLEVKLPTIWADEKQRWSRGTEKRREEERRSEKRKSQKKEDPGARKGRKVAKHWLPHLSPTLGSLVHMYNIIENFYICLGSSLV